MAPDVETNPLFGLMTDALRAGPGSPEWHQAVAKLRAEGMADSDEYKLLVTVREHLESGRDYRSIRAGPGFTRKVFESIEQERAATGKGGKIPLANIIAIFSVIAVVVVIGYIASQLLTPTPVPQETVEELENMYFPTEVASAKFEGALPVGWRKIGALPLEAYKNALRPVPPSGATTAPAEAIGGAFLAPQTLPADEPFAVVVQFKPGRPTEDVIVQVFVSAESEFSEDKATSSKELVWLIQGSRQKVVVGDSRVEFDGDRTDIGRPESTVRLVVNKQFAVVSNGTQRLWAGANGLDAKPRTVGVRFIRLDGTKSVDPATVQSIRILKK